MNLNCPATMDTSASVRIFDHNRLWRLDELAFGAAVDLLAAELAAEVVDAVVGIARGGLPLARALAERLGTPVAAVSARHNTTDDLWMPDSGTVSVNIADLPVPAGSRLVLCDDICGSGATLAAVQDALARQHVTQPILSVVLCRNGGAAIAPDMWVWDVRDWVVFPWETSPDEPTQLLPVPSHLHRRPA